MNNFPWFFFSSASEILRVHQPDPIESGPPDGTLAERLLAQPPTVRQGPLA